MSKESRTDRRAYVTLIVLYYLGRILSVFSWSLQMRTMKLQKPNRFKRIASIVWRLFLAMTFLTVMPTMLRSFLTFSQDPYLSILAKLLAISLTIFSGISYFVQDCSELEIFETFNRFVKIYNRVSRKTGAKQLLGKSFVYFTLLKLVFTFLGLLYEIPLLWEKDSAFNSLTGIYLWLGVTYTLDFCFLGFLIITRMYREMAAYLGKMIDKMNVIETRFERNQLSQYQCMKELCFYADSIDESNDIYHQLYVLTKHFHDIFRWQVVYYIYYNFVIVLMLFHRFIFLYIGLNYADFIAFFLAILKCCNLVLLIMCTDDVVKSSHLPDLLSLDLVCSDMDPRWDASVELFLCQRNVENLEIKVLGFFNLNNGFILVIISAIMSYLFILIQFGLTRMASLQGQESRVPVTD